MNRIPLRPGLSTPKFVDESLSSFGRNPHGEPIYRLIWSERKIIYFAGETIPEYTYIDPPQWVVEKWTAPDLDAGPEASWSDLQEFMLGPYPRMGTYNATDFQFGKDWTPNEESLRILCEGLRKSQDIATATRKKAIRENLEATAQVKRQEVADTIVELQDSASLGKIQQPVSGAKNNFRTAEDYERDMAKGLVSVELPKHGGKLVREN